MNDREIKELASLITKGLGRRALNMTASELSARSKKGWETRRRRGMSRSKATLLPPETSLKDALSSARRDSRITPLTPQSGSRTRGVTDLLHRTRFGDPPAPKPKAEPYRGGKPEYRYMADNPAGKRLNIGNGKSVVFPSSRPISQEKIRRDIDSIKESRDPDIDYFESSYDEVVYSVEQSLIEQIDLDAMSPTKGQEVRRIIADIAHIAGMKAIKAEGFKG